MTTKLYKDGNVHAITTDAESEESFISDVAQLFQDLAGDKRFEHDLEFQFAHWLPNVCDLVCSFRGYKATGVKMRTTYQAGEFSPHGQCISEIDTSAENIANAKNAKDARGGGS